VNYETMQRNIKICTKQIATLIKNGNSVSISHGNGPQVGSILLQNQNCENVSPMPLSVLGAQTQGEIGYLIQQSLLNELKGTNKTPVTLITQVEVDKNDEAFKNPSKPIGKFYTREIAQIIQKEGKIMKEELGKGFRIVVASPKPKSILESKIIKQFGNEQILILGGGGGVPVFKDQEGNFHGIDAVIDKDYVSSLIAKERSVNVRKSNLN
jgi:carbamate kinase